jgi:ABC-2 type transport system ATP-binding protein
MGDNLLEVRGLCKSFDGKPILSDVSFFVKPGEILGLIGKSGTGKTTIMKLLVGFYEPDKGSILLDGEDIKKNIIDLRSKVGFVTQDDCFYDELTVEENLEYFGKIYDIHNEAISHNIGRLLKFLKLEDARNKLAKNLSGGMRRRLDFACAMIHNPDILVMDEPTTGLDPILRKEFWDIIQHIRKSGKTIIFSSHLLEEIDQLADRVVIIDQGIVMAFGTLTEVKEQYTKSYEIHLETKPGDYKQIINGFKLKYDSISKCVFVGNKVVFFTPDPHDALRDIIPLLDACGEQIVDLDVEKPTLNEVFEFYVEEKKR